MEQNQFRTIIGCGIDIEQKGRFAKHLNPEDEGLGIIHDVFTPAEIMMNKSIGVDAFSLGFCCKEAMFKAIGESWLNGRVDWKDIQLIFKDPKNMDDYQVKVDGFAKELIDQVKVRHIESSYEIKDDYYLFKIILIK